MKTIKEIMTTDVKTIDESTPISEVVKIIMENNITGVPVVNRKGALQGIITDKDLIHLIVNKKDRLLDAPVSNYMSKEVVGFKEEDTIEDVSKFFLENPFRRVPVLKKGKLVGIVSRRDLIKYLFMLSGHDLWDELI